MQQDQLPWYKMEGILYVLQDPRALEYFNKTGKFSKVSGKPRLTSARDNCFVNCNVKCVAKKKYGFYHDPQKICN